MRSVDIFWLRRGADRELATHVLLGDDLGFASADGAVRWLTASPISQSPSAHVVLMRYEGGGVTIGFCVAASGEARNLIDDARKTTSPAAAAQKWGPLLGKFSYLSKPSIPRAEITSVELGRFSFVRRAAHVDPLIDRFLVRDRMVEAARLEEALGLAESAAEPGRSDEAPVDLTRKNNRRRRG